MIGDQPKIAEFPDETELHDTGQNGLQRFRKPKVALLSYVESAEINEPQIEVSCIQTDMTRNYKVPLARSSKRQLSSCD